MKHCKCGMPIYDEPEARTDKCYWCTVKAFSEDVEKNIFMNGRFYGEKLEKVGEQ